MATLHNAAYEEYQKKNKKVHGIAEILKNSNFWDALYAMTRAVFSILRVLQLADCSGLGMDKLFYYVRQTDE